MNVQTIGAFKRPKLSLPFGGRTHPGAPTRGPIASTLSDHELRRIVASMID